MIQNGSKIFSYYKRCTLVVTCIAVHKINEIMSSDFYDHTLKMIYMQGSSIIKPVTSNISIISVHNVIISQYSNIIII